MNKLIFTFVLFLFGLQAHSQGVQEAKYMIKYNEVNGLFDCSVIIEQGTASTPAERVILNSSFGFNVPTGSEIKVAENYNPHVNNQAGNVVDPTRWLIGASAIAPDENSERDFHIAIPSVSPSSFFNELTAGDTVLLFALQIDGINCKSDVKLNITGEYPEGINGADFNSGFVIGGLENRYTGNLNVDYNDNDCQLVSVEEAHDGIVKIYPNPSDGKVFIEGLSGDFQIRIHNLSGQEVFHRSYEAFADARLPIDGLAKGSYLISIFHKDFNKVKKLIVK